MIKNITEGITSLFRSPELKVNREENYKKFTQALADAEKQKESDRNKDSELLGTAYDKYVKNQATSYTTIPGDISEELSITHVPTGKKVAFPAFLTNWNDTYTQEWSPTTVMGRMDAIQTYKRTGRKISFAWDVPSSSKEMASSNYLNANTLMEMNYPVFDEINYSTYSSEANSANSQPGGISAQASTQTNLKTTGIMTSPPMFKIMFYNWANNLYGVIDSISFNPKFSGEDNGFWVDNGKVIPKVLSFSCNFTVIHTQKLGWNMSGELRSSTSNNIPTSFSAATENIG